MKKQKMKERLFDVVKVDQQSIRTRGPRHPKFPECFKAALKIPKGKALRFANSKEMTGLAKALQRELKRSATDKYFVVSKGRDMFNKVNAVLLYRKN